MITIYHASNARSLRVIWLMEELGEKYQVETMSFPVQPEFREINPLGCLPAIDDEGIRMFESVAILQYLTGRRLVAGDAKAAALTVGPQPDPAAYAEHLQFLHFGEADLTVPVGLLYRAKKQQTVDHPILHYASSQLSQRLAFLGSHFADGREWVTGEHFTIADISIGYAFHLARHGRIELELTTQTDRYWQRLQDRPAYQRAIER